jgi:molecular chaperone DnaK
MSEIIVGIDLGTTNSLIGAMEAGFPILLADADGERLVPSVVHFPKSGAPIVGRAAQRMRAAEPENTIYSAKRFMGRRVGDEASDVAYSIAGKRGETLRIVAAGKELAPEEIAALVLARLKSTAETSLATTISRAVITVPAYFNDAQRNATKRAGELAGLTVKRIVNEPTAAALAYGLDRLKDRSKIAVYDFGGGTFDISILELNEGVFQVLSTNGNTHLGGDDIDTAIIAHIAELAGISLEQHSATAARIREAAIAAKHTLSSADEARIELPFLLADQSFSHTITRTELESLARPIVERTRQHCMRALADAKLTPADLDDVILVGGQTRMPLIREFVRTVFSREPNVSQNPDEAVAIGATIQAGILSGAVQNVVLLDVTPLSLGIETFGGLMNIIIPRNSTIPIKRGELFTNAVSGQQSMLIRVLQGEREMAKDNWELGKFEIPFQPSPKGSARVGVQFEIDANGILHVLARDTVTGAEKIIKMTSAVDVSDEAVEKMLEDSLEHAFEDMNDRVFTEASLKANELLPAVKMALAQVGDALSAADRDAISACAADVETALAAGGAPALKKAVAALDNATQHLAAILVEKAMREAGARKS